MKFTPPQHLSDIAALIQAEVIGETNSMVLGINEIHRVEPGDLVFVDHPKYYKKCLESEATFVIINTKDVPLPQGKALLVVNNPFEAYQIITNTFRPFQPNCHLLSSSASIGKTTVLMPNVYIGNHVTIGEGCVIHPNVVIHDHTIIRNNVIIQANTVLGGDGFYYNSKKNRAVFYEKMNSCGNVLIEDFVEIGCNCTIDRGVSATTTIGMGTKIDNQVHIAHDVIIGKNCLIAAQVGIAGATVLEDEVQVWGQAGINKTLTIGRGAVIMAMSGVNKTIEGNTVYWGSPVQPIKEKQKELVWIKRIPELWQAIKSNINVDEKL